MLNLMDEPSERSPGACLGRLMAVLTVALIIALVLVAGSHERVRAFQVQCFNMPVMEIRPRPAETLSFGVLVPLSAIVSASGEHAAQEAVFVVGTDRVAREQKVKTGRIEGNSVEIKEGLKAGDRIVTLGASILFDGALISVSSAGGE